MSWQGEKYTQCEARPSEAQGKRAQGHLQPRRTMRKAYRENETGVKH